MKDAAFSSGVFLAPPENFPEAMQRELSRALDLLAVYQRIPTGVFGAAMIRAVIDAANAALTSGDIGTQVAAYKRLKDLE